MTIDSTPILEVTRAVTKKWTKHRRVESRGIRRDFNLTRSESDRVTHYEVLCSILPKAYEHASGGGTFTVSKRQLYYACREEFRQWTDCELHAGNFSHDLLVKYLNRHPETSSWKITADPRGTLTIPNAHHEERVPCGTLAMDDHLKVARNPADAIKFENIPREYPSLKHHERYQAVLYIEKEGFEPLLHEAQIAERYDLAILSCKGQSVVAARYFVDEVCNVHEGVPLFVVHDFDKAGFEISQRLTTVSKSAEDSDRVAYRFRHEINVTDLGLRLADIEKYRLGFETAEFKGRFAADSITTSEEQEYLRTNRRVELNAFTSPQFVAWLEAKLVEHGLGKRLIPDDDVLESAFRRAVAASVINSAISNVREEAERQATAAVLPPTFRSQLEEQMTTRPGEAWDRSLYRLAARLYRGKKL